MYHNLSYVCKHYLLQAGMSALNNMTLKNAIASNYNLLFINRNASIMRVN